ncbi:MAG: dihydroorotate dehydrogenase electron transfer subunit [Eubacteriales bacterium]|nr:dihydroorotate dehydrogenase electron transfer subunit [Eubacteriales bacterium]
MYKKNVYTVLENECIAESVYRMVLEGDTSYITVPGQFINLKLEGRYLRRPISVCDWDENTITIIYKVVGDGTKDMSEAVRGDRFDILTGLGNGFSTGHMKKGQHAVVIGGGVGVPPLYALVKKLIAEGVKVTAVLGFNEKAQIFYEEEFKKIGAEVFVTTVDGSYGTKGFVTDVLKDIDYDFYFTCGPEPMLRAVHKLGKEKNVCGLLSFEARMGCGFGACMGCSCETIAGNKRICVEGPVMKSEEVML